MKVMLFLRRRFSIHSAIMPMATSDIVSSI
jgi:hypothetical protein